MSHRGRVNVLRFPRQGRESMDINGMPCVCPMRCQALNARYLIPSNPPIREAFGKWACGLRGFSTLLWVSELAGVGDWNRPRAFHLQSYCYFLGRLALLQGRGPGYLNHKTNELNAPPEIEPSVKAPDSKARA